MELNEYHMFLSIKDVEENFKTSSTDKTKKIKYKRDKVKTNIPTVRFIGREQD